MVLNHEGIVKLKIVIFALIFFLLLGCIAQAEENHFYFLLDGIKTAYSRGDIVSVRRLLTVAFMTVDEKSDEDLIEKIQAIIKQTEKGNNNSSILTAEVPTPSPTVPSENINGTLGENEIKLMSIDKNNIYFIYNGEISNIMGLALGLTKEEDIILFKMIMQKMKVDTYIKLITSKKLSEDFLLYIYSVGDQGSNVFLIEGSDKRIYGSMITANQKNLKKDKYSNLVLTLNTLITGADFDVSKIEKKYLLKLIDDNVSIVIYTLNQNALSISIDSELIIVALLSKQLYEKHNEMIFEILDY